MIRNRRVIQALAAAIVYYVVFVLGFSLLYTVLIAGALGIVFGKTFCRWMCPMGALMELMTKGLSGDAKKQQLYNYHKLGCPIAWIQGLLNRFSFFKIKREADSCTDCGLCDKACYIATLNKEFSLHKPNKQDPSTAYNCSKCLSCVDDCPTGALAVKLSR